MSAQYERAKFLEGSRGGNRHARHLGQGAILCQAPAGSGSGKKQEGGGEARFDSVFDEARIVQQVFTWVGQERCTSKEVGRRLHQAGIRTQTGQDHWDHKTIWHLLKNPADKGEAAVGKTHWTAVKPRLRAPRGRPEHSGRGYAGTEAPPEAWITLPVPALVDAAWFDAVQAQWEENRRRARIPEKGSGYLVPGLLVCAKCGDASGGRPHDARHA